MKRGTPLASSIAMRRFPLFLLALAPLAFAACVEHYYSYEPATNTSAQIAGRVAANYPIPPEAPRGNVRIASFGFADLVPQGGPGGATIRTLHLREIVANNSSVPWVIDTREQRLVIAARGESRPAYAAADPGTPPPQVEVPAGGSRTIDLFFPLPPGLADADEIPAFDTIWSVQTDTRLVTERTPFERIEIVPRYYYDYYYYPWGPYWYDPYYPSGAFIGVGVLPPAFVHRPIIIHGEFHGHRRR